MIFETIGSEKNSVGFTNAKYRLLSLHFDFGCFGSSFGCRLIHRISPAGLGHELRSILNHQRLHSIFYLPITKTEVHVLPENLISKSCLIKASFVV